FKNFIISQIIKSSSDGISVPPVTEIIQKMLGNDLSLVHKLENTYTKVKLDWRGAVFSKCRHLRS
ncbi:MAG: hypothetical protein SCK70_04460, partial [bacterium]|nr:hypothetical protein [bacterium]